MLHNPKKQPDKLADLQLLARHRHLLQSLINLHPIEIVQIEGIVVLVKQVTVCLRVSDHIAQDLLDDVLAESFFFFHSFFCGILL